MKNVLWTKVKYLRLGHGPVLGLGKFIVIFCFRVTELVLCSAVLTGHGAESLVVKG